MNVQGTSAPDGHFLVFDYLYRDSSNYKAFGSVWLSGTLDDAMHNELLDCLESGEFFVAEQVGVPPLYSLLFGIEGGPTDDDHAWHTFEGFRYEGGLATGTQLWGSASMLVDAFRSAKENWQPELSPNFD